jgi:hypothetical protein
MWQLYQVIGKTSHDDTPVIKEVLSIIDRITNNQFLRCLDIMRIPTAKEKAEVSGILFTKSLIFNKYFDFQFLIGKLNGRS